MPTKIGDRGPSFAQVDEDIMRIMRGKFFKKGMRGKRPGALLQRLCRSFYEGQLAGYLWYLHEKEIAARSERISSTPIPIENIVAATRRDRIIAGAIGGCSLVCASYVAAQLFFFLPNGTRVGFGFPTKILYALLGIMLGFLVLLGYQSLRVVFRK
jgi:hypothetical protein